ncbi:MAG: phosphoribosyltransferase family protein [Thermoanaerobaculia bacterium]
MNLPEVLTLYSASAIEERVRALGRRLEADHEVPDPLVVALVGGSVVFVADLVRAVQRPIRFDSIQVQFSLSGADDDILEIHYPISLDVSDQILIVIKDVSTSGVIENYLSSQFLQGGARQVRFATLIDVPTERKTDFKPDYSVFVVESPALFVGYGLRYRGRYGNLPYIGRLIDDTAGI